jgi:hypothetical protein
MLLRIARFSLYGILTEEKYLIHAAVAKHAALHAPRSEITERDGAPWQLERKMQTVRI